LAKNVCGKNAQKRAKSGVGALRVMDQDEDED
jgi:hypothetical protein